MSPTTVTALPDTAATRPAPGWARLVAHLVPLVTLPSGVWRIAMAVGVPVGFTAEVLRTRYNAPGWGSLYMFGLSLLVEALALLTLGLVRPWGEVWPQWVPRLGGRRIPARAVSTAALLGAALLILIGVSQVVLYLAVPGSRELHGTAEVVFLACYTPLLAWGPMLLAVAYDHRHRHRV